jgi:hypothetical protein
VDRDSHSKYAWLRNWCRSGNDSFVPTNDDREKVRSVFVWITLARCPAFTTAIKKKKKKQEEKNKRVFNTDSAKSERERVVNLKKRTVQREDMQSQEAEESGADALHSALHETHPRAKTNVIVEQVVDPSAVVRLMLIPIVVIDRSLLFLTNALSLSLFLSIAIH